MAIKSYDTINENIEYSTLICCQSQGALILRIQRKFILEKCHRYIDTLLEPVGSALPKFSSKSNLAAYQEKALHALALTCPAQGSPLPSFR